MYKRHIYNLETKELNNIELGHDAEQMTINENVIYILSDKIIYQYELDVYKRQSIYSSSSNYCNNLFGMPYES